MRFLLSVFIVLVCCSYVHSLSTSPKKQALNLIKSLNLSPKHSINLPSRLQPLPPTHADTVLVEKPLKPLKLRFHGESGPSVQDFGHHAGYFKLPHAKAARMFYFLFESRTSKSDPVVIWLTGGPGCSSELALFYENGPYHLSKNLSLEWNEYGWDKGSNLIFVDQPTGTGFSYTTDASDLRHDENGVSNDLYDFLQAFFKKHPELVNNDFYITGESYAGHYIPAFASRVHKGNKNKEGLHINLKGFAIGNGLTNPAIQYNAYTDYALQNNLIGQSDYDYINQYIPSCEQQIKACGTNGTSTCESAFETCTGIFNEVLNAAGNGLNYYDIRKQCEGSLCYDFSDMETFLNQKTVRDALGVGNLEFVSCSSDVYDAMERDWMRNLEAGIPDLLEDGIKVLIYAGEKDLICNWIGNSRWVNAMEWSGKKDFVAASNISFTVEGAEAGQLKTHGPLTFLKVYEAGHMVPMDQPKAALQMLKSWMQGKIADSDRLSTQ
ncbi:serine carboxypeptidase-like [Euphorbia lathyris]|uniref:serine carboxypeptidase-like n=1 Tax=Euphorbia lathyris TaxID=212925 RepID=UPI003313490F